MQQLESVENGFPPNLEPILEKIDHWVHRSNSLRAQVYRYDPSLHSVMLSDEGEALIYKEAMSCELSNKWELEMQEEIKSLYANNTWDLVSLHEGKLSRIIGFIM